MINRLVWMWALASLLWSGCDQASPDDERDAGTERDADQDANQNANQDANQDANRDANQDAGQQGEGCEGEGDWQAVPVAEQYYPLVDGARWVYRHSGGSTDWDEEVTMTAQRHEGRDAFLLSDTAGPSGTNSDSVLLAGRDAVCRVYKEVFAGERLQASAEYVPGFTRFDRRWLSWEPGRTESVTYRRTEFDPQDIMVRDGDRTHEFTIEAHDETVSVPAGEFEGCLRVFRDRIREFSVAEAEDEDKYFWFCPGVGKVREEDATGVQIEELLECDVPGGGCG